MIYLIDQREREGNRNGNGIGAPLIPRFLFFFSFFLFVCSVHRFSFLFFPWIIFCLVFIFFLLQQQRGDMISVSESSPQKSFDRKIFESGAPTC